MSSFTIPGVKEFVIFLLNSCVELFHVGVYDKVFAIIRGSWTLVLEPLVNIYIC